MKFMFNKIHVRFIWPCVEISEEGRITKVYTFDGHESIFMMGRSLKPCKAQGSRVWRKSVRYRLKRYMLSLEYMASFGINEFSRIDYMRIFKSISTSTASRDVKKGVELRILNSIGNKNKTKYTLHNRVTGFAPR